MGTTFDKELYAPLLEVESHTPWCKSRKFERLGQFCAEECSCDYKPKGITFKGIFVPFDNDLKKREFAMAEKPSNPKDLIGSNKVPLSLVPGTTKAYLAIGHLEGHLKYGLANFRESGVKASIYLDALERHIEKYKNGGWEDPVTLVPHLANALACISIIVDAHECGKLIDDRPKSAPVGDVIDRMSENVIHLKKLFEDKKPIDYFITGPKQRE